MLILNGLVALFPKLCSDLDTGFFLFFYERLNNVHNFIVKFAPDLPMSRRAKSWGNVLIKKKKKSLCENLSTDLDSARNFALGTPNIFRCGKKNQKKNWQVATGVFRKFPVVQPKTIIQ